MYWQFPYTLYEDGVFVRQLEYPEIWPRAREAGARIINVAHPVTFTPYLRHVGFDPPDVIPRLDELDPGLFSTDFDTIELLNGLEDNHVMLELVLPIWSSFNNQGLFKTADWVPVEQVALVANGETVETLPLQQPGQVDPAHPAVRFDGAVAVDPTRDTWYAAVATGREDAIKTAGPHFNSGNISRRNSSQFITCMLPSSNLEVCPDPST